jgi:long-subunit acyl-CoA synthetase (AMP-forming)
MFAVQADSGWQPVTAAQLAGRVGAVAAGLIATGIRPGGPQACFPAAQPKQRSVATAVNASS